MHVSTILFGAVVGLSLGLTGGGGAIFAVPLLVYGLGVDPRQAIGVSLVTVGTTALVGFFERLRSGAVEVRTGLVFAAAGMAAAPLGARAAARIPESLLLTLFALLMLTVAWRMWRSASPEDDALPATMLDEPLLEESCSGGPRLDESARQDSGPVCRRGSHGELQWNSRCGLLLAVVGLAAGFLTGFFGVGGGFVIVPALVLVSGMNIRRAVGTSLLVIALVSVSGIASLVGSGGRLPWESAAWFTGGSLLGLSVGSRSAARLPAPTLRRVFAGAIVLVALFVLTKNLFTSRSLSCVVALAC